MANAAKHRAALVQTAMRLFRRQGFASTGLQQIVESSDWAEFRREWRETFADHAKAAGIEYRFAESAPPAGTAEGTLLLATVTDYRLVGVGARVMFGLMTGNAYIRALNAEGEQEIARYDLSEDASTETAMIFGELYRNNDEWKFKAIGQGYAGGLAAVARDFGVNLG